MHHEEESKKCEGCGRGIGMGDDVVTLQRCVIGPRGAVPVEDVRLFCDEQCVCGDNGDEPVRLSRRIP